MELRGNYNKAISIFFCSKGEGIYISTTAEFMIVKFCSLQTCLAQAPYIWCVCAHCCGDYRPHLCRHHAGRTAQGQGHVDVMMSNVHRISWVPTFGLQLSYDSSCLFQFKYNYPLLELISSSVYAVTVLVTAGFVSFIIMPTRIIRLELTSLYISYCGTCTTIR